VLRGSLKSGDAVSYCGLTIGQALSVMSLTPSMTWFGVGKGVGLVLVFMSLSMYIG